MWFCYIIIFWDCFFFRGEEKVSASCIVFPLQVAILFLCFGLIVDLFSDIPNFLFSAQVEKEMERLIGISELTRWDLLIIGFTVEWLAWPIIWGITDTSFFRSFSWNVQILGKDYTPLLLASEGLGASVLEAKWGKWFVHQISLFSVNLSLKCVWYTPSSEILFYPLQNKDTSPRKRHSRSLPREGQGWLPSYTKEDKWSWNLYLKLNFNQFLPVFLHRYLVL